MFSKIKAKLRSSLNFTGKRPVIWEHLQFVNHVPVKTLHEHSFLVEINMGCVMRRSFGILAGLFFAILIAAADARAQDFFQTNGGLYLSGRGGLSQVRATSLLFFPALDDYPVAPDKFPSQQEYRNIEMDYGFVAGAAIGYTFVYPGYGGAIRIEAEGIYRRNKDGETNAEWNSTDTSNSTSFGHVVAPIDGTFEVASAMLNVLMDIHTGTRFTPYLGLGAGYSRVRIDALLDDFPRGDAYFCAVPPCDPFVLTVIDETHYALSWQAIVGVSFQLTQSLALTLEARHFKLAADRFSRLHGLQSLENYTFDDYSMGFRLTF